MEQRPPLLQGFCLVHKYSRSFFTPWLSRRAGGVSPNFKLAIKPRKGGSYLTVLDVRAERRTSGGIPPTYKSLATIISLLLDFTSATLLSRPSPAWSRGNSLWAVRDASVRRWCVSPCATRPARRSGWRSAIADGHHWSRAPGSRSYRHRPGTAPQLCWCSSSWWSSALRWIPPPRVHSEPTDRAGRRTPEPWWPLWPPWAPAKRRPARTSRCTSTSASSSSKRAPNPPFLMFRFS